VHRNHGFEPISRATGAYGAWNGYAFDWLIGGYDDSLYFDVEMPADVEVVWLDSARFGNLGEAAFEEWLIARLEALRLLTTNPILLLAWPLPAAARERVAAASIPGCFVADLEPLAEKLGPAWLDRRAESISGTRLGNRACLELARELACRWLPATIAPPRKAIAVDLDGTLYSGVLGEDGPEGVELTSGHRALQQHLLELRRQGILLAVVSKNELADVENLFAHRPDFPLRLDDFSAIDVSWDEKSAALDRISAKLRIGTDAIVFVDDNPGELAAASCTSAITVHARPDAAETKAALEYVSGIFRWHDAVEDRLRADDLRASEARDVLRRTLESQDAYLSNLQIRLQYFVGAREHLARMAELARKTNQFNLSLRRTNETELARRIEQRSSNVIAIRLTDRLADSGIVGVLVGTRDADRLIVEEICVSCRALGRRLEDSMLTRALLLMAAESGVNTVVFSVRKGPRNTPARQWLSRYVSAEFGDDADQIAIPFSTIADRQISSAIGAEVLR
jgi:FkbH-like protein